MPRGQIPDPNAQRRNAPTIPMTELAGDVGLALAPKLPTSRAWKKLRPGTKKWWKAVLEAPQATNFGGSDWRRLEMVVLPLVDRFNRELEQDDPDPHLLVKLADAIARQEKEFGLTPESRLRLRFVLRPKVAAGSTDEEAKSPAKPRATKSDPRRELEVVQGGKR